MISLFAFFAFVLSIDPPRQIQFLALKNYTSECQEKFLHYESFASYRWQLPYLPNFRDVRQYLQSEPCPFIWPLEEDWAKQFHQSHSVLIFNNEDARSEIVDRGKEDRRARFLLLSPGHKMGHLWWQKLRPRAFALRKKFIHDIDEEIHYSGSQCPATRMCSDNELTQCTCKERQAQTVPLLTFNEAFEKNNTEEVERCTAILACCSVHNSSFGVLAKSLCPWTSFASHCHDQGWRDELMQSCCFHCPSPDYMIELAHSLDENAPVPAYFMTDGHALATLNSDIMQYARKLRQKGLLMRMVTQIRDPRDVICSGYFYHRHCPESWMKQPNYVARLLPWLQFLPSDNCDECSVIRAKLANSSLSSLSYCSALQHLGNDDEGLILESLHAFTFWRRILLPLLVTGSVVEDVDHIYLRYEDLWKNTNATVHLLGKWLFGDDFARVDSFSTVLSRNQRRLASIHAKLAAKGEVFDEQHFRRGSPGEFKNVLKPVHKRVFDHLGLNRLLRAFHYYENWNLEET